MSFKVDKTAIATYLTASRGSQLIPLHKWDTVDQHGRERGKSPRDGNWTNRSYTWDEVASAQEAGHNLGYRLEAGELIVDMDPRNMDVDRDTAVAALDAEFGLDLANSPRVITGGGGYHIYCKVPAEFVGQKFRNEIPGYPGVEFKGAGRQVVAAGSKHPSGNMYEWLNDDKGYLYDNIKEVTPEFMQAIVRQSKTRTGDVVENISLEKLEEYLSVLDVEDYDDNESWLALAMSCYHATNGEGIEPFLAWSLQDSRYANDEEMIRLRWDSFAGGEGITSGTLMHAVAQSGRGDILKDEPEAAFEMAPFTDQDVEIIKNIPEAADNEGLFERTREGQIKRTVNNTMLGIEALGLVLSRNALKDEVIVGGDFETMRQFHPNMNGAFDDSLMHAVVSALITHFQFEPSLQQVHQALVTLSLKNEFHPIRDYLNGLTWDGVDRISDYLTKFCGAPQTQYTTTVGENLLKAAVGRAMQPGIKYDTMVILEGIQGCGKSTMLKVLGGEWTLEGLPNKQDLNNKDVIQALQGYWIVEVEELAVMRKSDVDSLKAFLTRQTDKTRFAYAREAKEYPRQCVFVGTTNDNEYLLDSTGNRRFLPVEVGTVDLDGLQAARDQLWAQAVQLWKQNPTEAGIMLPQALWSDAAQEQEDRRVQDPVEYRLRDFLAKTDETFVTTQMLLWEVLAKSPADSDMKDSRRIGRAMMSMTGWQVGRREINGRREKGYERKVV